MKTKSHLKESLALSRAMFDEAPMGVALIDSLTGQLYDINDCFCRIVGRSREDLLKLDWMSITHPDDVQSDLDNMARLNAGEITSFNMSKRYIHTNGSIVWGSLTVAPIKVKDKNQPLHLAMVEDITKRKQSEEMLRESEERFRNIAEMLPEIVFELDLSGNIKFSNKKAYEIFGYTEEDFAQGLNALEMIIPEERALASERIRQRLAGEVVGAKEYTALRKDGSTFPVILSATPVIKGLGPVGMLGIMTDISERKSNEIALMASTQAAEAAKQAKDLFLAKVSHEIRTPLTAIIGFGELLEDADLTPEHKKYLTAINTSSSALSSLIEDILDLSKLETGSLVVTPKEFSLHNLITNLAATQEQQIARKSLSFNISNDNDIPDLLIGDPLRIQQVLLNLLSNAIKFTEKGDIGIAVSVVEKSHLRVLLDIAVKDTGIGIPTGQQEQIFEPFTQVFDPSIHNYSGSGLGLTISRALADLMGGSLHVESRECVGSTFRLLVPLQRNIDNLSGKHLPERESLQWSGPTLNILLAEDNPVNTQFIKIILERMGHVVTVAENGKVALDTLRTNTFDLMLIDIQMPVMNGVDALKVLRELELLNGKHLTVIALTAYALIGDKEKYLKIGFDGYLSKPFTTRALVDELVRVVPS